MEVERRIISQDSGINLELLKKVLPGLQQVLSNHEDVLPNFELAAESFRRQELTAGPQLWGQSNTEHMNGG